MRMNLVSDNDGTEIEAKKREFKKELMQFLLVGTNEDPRLYWTKCYLSLELLS